MDLNAGSAIQELFKSLPWWGSPVAFLIYVVLLFALQWTVFRLFRIWASRRESPWYGLALQALQQSIVLFLVSGLVGMAPLIFRMSKDWKKAGGVAAELLAILALAVFFQKLLTAAYRQYVAKDHEHRSYSSLIHGLINAVVYAVFLMIFLDAVGISITPLIASLGVGSVAVAFALQETLASLFAGLYLVTDRPIRAGDYVSLEGGVEGYVDTIGWRSVRVKTLANNVVVVPNAKVASGIITNFTLIDRAVFVFVELSVAYGSALDLVEQATLETAREIQEQVEDAVSGFDPGFQWKAFGDSGLEFRVVLKARDFASQIPVRNAFVKKLHQRYQRDGIEIPYPTRTMVVKDSSEKNAGGAGKLR